MSIPILTKLLSYKRSKRELLKSKRREKMPSNRFNLILFMRNKMIAEKSSM